MLPHMQELWNRLEAWAKKNANRSLRLRKGASEKQIAAAEKKMKVKFPADFRASLLCHDGQETKDKEARAFQDEHGGFCGFEWMPGCSPLAPLDAIVAQWKEDQENIDDDEKPKVIEKGLLHNVMFHPRRIPIAGTPYWDGDNTYLDLFPGPKGKEGQIVMFANECDMVVMGDSMSHALTLHLLALESGDWVWDKKKGFAHPKKEKADDFPHESEEFVTWARKQKPSAR